MSLLKTLSKKLTPEQLQEVQDALGDDFNYDMVPRSRLNAVIKQRDTLKEQLAGMSHDPEEDDDDDDDDGIDDTSKGAKGTEPKKSEKPLTEKALKKLLAAKDKEKEDALKAQKVEFATREKLREAKAKDLDIVFGLLDKTKLTIGEDGKLDGFDDQLKTLTESKSFLFGETDNNTGGERGTGRTGGTGGKGKEDVLDSKLADVFSNYGITVTDDDDE